MNGKQKILAIYAGVAIIAVLLYLWWKSKTPSANTTTVVSPTATTPATSPGTVATTGPVPVTSTTTAVAATLNPVTNQSTPVYYAANGSVVVPSIVMQTAQTAWGANNYAQFLKMLPQMSGSEIQSLQDIMVNVWGTSNKMTPAQTAFWNAWRQKYHIEDGTIDNFMRPKRLYKPKTR